MRRIDNRTILGLSAAILCAGWTAMAVRSLARSNNAAEVHGRYSARDAIALANEIVGRAAPSARLDCAEADYKCLPAARSMPGIVWQVQCWNERDDSGWFEWDAATGRLWAVSLHITSIGQPGIRLERRDAVRRGARLLRELGFIDESEACRPVGEARCNSVSWVAMYRAGARQFMVHMAVATGEMQWIHTW